MLRSSVETKDALLEVCTGDQGSNKIMTWSSPWISNCNMMADCRSHQAHWSDEDGLVVAIRVMMDSGFGGTGFLLDGTTS